MHYVLPRLLSLLHSITRIILYALSKIILQGVPQNSLRFSFVNFSAYNSLRIRLFDIVQQHFPLAVQNFQCFKDWAILDQVQKEILTGEKIKFNKIHVR